MPSPKDPEKRKVWLENMSKAHFKGGSGKRIHLLYANENGFTYSIYIKITALGEVLEPHMHLVEESNFEGYLFKRIINSSGMCLICGELDFTVFHEHHIDKDRMPDFTITLCGNCHNRHHFYYGK